MKINPQFDWHEKIVRGIDKTDKAIKKSINTAVIMFWVGLVLVFAFLWFVSWNTETGFTSCVLKWYHDEHVKPHWYYCKMGG